MTAVKNDRLVDGTAIWESKRNQCKAEFAVKCVLSAIWTPCTMVASVGYIPTLFNYPIYWSPITAQQIALKIKSSTLQQIIEDTTNKFDPIIYFCMWYRQYTITSLVRYGFIDKNHGNCIKDFIKQYKTAKKIIGFYQSNFSDTFNHTNQEFVEAKKQMTQLNETWIQYRDLVLTPRLPNPGVKYDSSKK